MDRDLQKEKRAIGVFGQRNGRQPDLNNPQERSDVYNLAYPEGIPEELKTVVDESAQAGGVNNREQAFNEYQKFSQPNEAMRILQNAIKTKIGSNNQSIGESEIFKQAGVDGYGALPYSLNARNKEMQINQAEFSNIIGQMAGQYQDQMNSAKDRYDKLTDEYNAEQKRMQDVEDQARQQEYAIRRMKLQNDMDIDALDRISLKDRIEMGLDTPELTKVEDIVDETPKYVPPKYQTMVDSVAYDIGVPRQLLASLIQQESGWNPNASNVNDKEASFGLGQINLNAHPEITKGQAMNPYFAIPWVAKRLKESIDKNGLYNGIQAYNTPGAIGSEQLKSYANKILSRTKKQKSENVDKLSPLAKWTYEGKYVPKTPSQLDKIYGEIGDAGLDMPIEQDIGAVIKGTYDALEKLKKIGKDKRGQIQGRWSELTKAEERDQDIQDFKSTRDLVGMFLARVIEKGRLSDQDRDFYLSQMPNLRQNDDKVASKSADAVISTMLTKIGSDKSVEDWKKEIEANKIDLSEYANKNVILQDPKTGEEKMFNNISKEDLEDAIGQGYLIK